MTTLERPKVKRKGNQYTNKFTDTKNFIGRCYFCGSGVKYYSGWILVDDWGSSKLKHRPGTCGKRTL